MSRGSLCLAVQGAPVRARSARVRRRSRVDAACYDTSALLERLISLPEPSQSSWQPRWAASSRVSNTRHATPTGATVAVACTHVDGRPIAVTSGRDRTVRIWNLTNGIPLGLLTGHTGPVTAAACAQLDGRPIAFTSSWDRTVQIWDLRTRLRIDRIDLPRDVKAVTGTPAGGLVVASGWDIILFERSTEQLT